MWSAAYIYVRVICYSLWCPGPQVTTGGVCQGCSREREYSKWSGRVRLGQEVFKSRGSDEIGWVHHSYFPFCIFFHGAYHLPPWKGLYFHRRCSASIYIFSLSVEVGGNFHHLPQPNPVGAAIYFHQLPQASLLPWKLFYFQRKTVYCHRRTFLFNASRFVTSMKVKFTSADYFCFHGVNLLAWSYSRTRLCEGSTTRSRYRAEAGQ